MPFKRTIEVHQGLDLAVELISPTTANARKLAPALDASWPAIQTIISEHDPRIYETRSAADNSRWRYELAGRTLTPSLSQEGDSRR